MALAGGIEEQRRKEVQLELNFALEALKRAAGLTSIRDSSSELLELHFSDGSVGPLCQRKENGQFRAEEREGRGRRMTTWTKEESWTDEDRIPRVQSDSVRVQADSFPEVLGCVSEPKGNEKV